MNTRELAGAGNGHEVMHYDTEGDTLLYKYVYVWLFFLNIRNLEIAQLSDEYNLIVSLDAGCVVLKDTSTVYDETNIETFTIKEGEPNSAKVAIQGQVTMKKDDETADKEDSGLDRWDTRVQASSNMWCDEEFFYLKSQLTAWHNNEACFDKTWTKKIERFHI